MKDNGAQIWTLAVVDRFGDNGITGLMILKPEEGWSIDTFLMSCRVLGKGIEEAFFKTIIGQYKGELHAVYIPTAKNGQVADFYEKMGLKKESSTADGAKEYIAQIETLDTTIKDYYKIE